MKLRKPIIKNDLGKIIREIDTRPLDQRIKVKRLRPGQKPEAVEQLLFDNDLQRTNNDPDSLLPDYVKKHQKNIKST